VWIQVQSINSILYTINPYCVDTGTAVAKAGLIQVKHNRKTAFNIKSKSVRPEIISAHPQYGVEHVRDSFRFKCVVYTFSDALEFVMAMDQVNCALCTVHYALYTMHCTLCTVHYALYTMHCTRCTVHYTNPLYALCTMLTHCMHYALCSPIAAPPPQVCAHV
jgi:hypothetical protein